MRMQFQKLLSYPACAQLPCTNCLMGNHGKDVFLCMPSSPGPGSCKPPEHEMVRVYVTFIFWSFRVFLVTHGHTKKKQQQLWHTGWNMVISRQMGNNKSSECCKNMWLNSWFSAQICAPLRTWINRTG